MLQRITEVGDVILVNKALAVAGISKVNAKG